MIASISGLEITVVLEDAKLHHLHAWGLLDEVAVWGNLNARKTVLSRVGDMKIPQKVRSSVGAMSGINGSTNNPYSGLEK